jgi:hypothetical protein
LSSHFTFHSSFLIRLGPVALRPTLADGLLLSRMKRLFWGLFRCGCHRRHPSDRVRHNSRSGAEVSQIAGDNFLSRSGEDFGGGGKGEGIESAEEGEREMASRSDPREKG